MATILQSNKAYQGSQILPNIIDRIADLNGKTAFLKSLLTADGADPSVINASNTSALFDKLKAYRLRVISDGGIIISLPKTLQALVFNNTNGVADLDYTAYSAAFGLKLSGLNVDKVYDLSANNADLTKTLGGFTRATDSGFDVIANTSPTVYVSQSKGITAAGGGFILGASSHDTSTASGLSNRVRPMILSITSTGSGVPHAFIENNQGDTAKATYVSVTNGTVAASYSQVGAEYKKYAGMAALLPDGIKPYLYENGVRKNGENYPVKAHSGVTVFPNITIDVANAFVRESWLIRSSSQDLATALSVYLMR